MADDIFKELKNQISEATTEALDELEDVLFELIEEKASLIDHSLQELKVAGHPYSKRLPKLMHLGNAVHKQGGTLLEAIESERDSYAVTVGINTDIAPHATFVITGTETMVSRDFVTEAYEDLEREGTITKAFEKYFKKIK